MKILIVEDDEKIATQLSSHLNSSGFVCKIENDGEDGHFEGEEDGYDAILLDIGLPSMDGFTILQKWRESGIKTPVVIVTARDSKIEIIKGLEAGADDYVTKPFDLQEVVARLRSVIRRHNNNSSSIYKYKNVELDTINARVTVDGSFLKLTRIEFLMLQYLFSNQGRPVNATELADHTYDDFDNDSRIIAKHIANIRKKIGQEIIRTETNRGYYVPKETN